MASQALGLAEAVGFPVVEKEVRLRSSWYRLLPALWIDPGAVVAPGSAALMPPWPDMVIACGREVTALAAAIKRASGGAAFWVQVQDPRFARQQVDLMVVPRHDPVRGANVLVTLGAVHRVRLESIEAARACFASRFQELGRPLLGVLLGGSNRAYRLTPMVVRRLAAQLAALARQGVGIAITPSRRTGESALALLRRELAGLPHYLWDGASANPYLGLLAHADALAVTADSVNMLSEAAATGKPVHVIELAGGSAKFRRFHAGLQNAGVTRPFDGRVAFWTYPPLDDTERAAAEIRRRFARRLAPVA